MRRVPLRETAGEQQETHQFHWQQPISKIPIVIRPPVPTRIAAAQRWVKFRVGHQLLESQSEVQAACENYPSSTLAGVVSEDCSNRAASEDWEVSAARRRALVGNGGGKGKEQP